MNAPVDIFIAYSHDDLSFKNELKKFLRPMLREELITLWDDFDIEAGEEWDAAIKKRLYSADVVLLLVSSDSLASDYFYGKEVEVSLKRHKMGETVVVPVILRHCDWEKTPLGALEALPEKGRPVVEWPTRDQAFQDVVSKLRRVVEGVQHTLKLATAQAEALRQYTAACLAAEHLFAKANWPEARQAYTDALALFLPGFSPDRNALEKKIQEIDQVTKQAAEVSLQAEASRREQEKAAQDRAAKQQQEAAARQRREQEAKQFQREQEAWQAALTANTPEALLDFAAQYPQSTFVREARQRARALRPTQASPDAGKQRLLWIGGSVVLAILLAVWLWPKPEQTPGMGTIAVDTEASDNMVQIRGGTFSMGDLFAEGSSDETPTHSVTLGNFLLGKTEVTFDEYDAFCAATGREKPSDSGWGRGSRPVINVDWYDAVEYCNWLSQRQGLTAVYTIDKNRKDPNNNNTDDTKKWIVTSNWTANGYRLPTEAEWEYAARELGKKVRFGNGKDIADPAEINFNGSAAYKKDYSVVGEYRQQTAPVGEISGAANSLGLRHMSGNVWEWCYDWYHADYYKNSAAKDPKGADSGKYRVLRGGSWYFNPADVRCAYRNWVGPFSQYYAIGFRVARGY